MTTIHRIASMALASTAVGMTVLTWGQTAEPAGPTPPTTANGATAQKTDDSQLDAMVVTATKIVTRPQDTLFAIRAISGAEMTKAAVPDVSGLQRLAPDLGITPDWLFTTFRF